MTKSRIEHIDLAAGIMLLWMMLTHCGIYNTILGQYGCRLFFFFMPWFFYKSGMFFAPKEARIIGGGKLLKPFLIWSIVGYFIYAIVQMVLGTDALYNLLVKVPIKAALFENLVRCNGHLWFLLTLFCVINIANHLIKNVDPIFTIIIGIIIGYIINLLHSEYIPDIMANTATGLCFFSMGYMLQGKESNRWIVGGAIVGYIIAIILLHSPFVDMRLNYCCYSDRTGYDYLLWFPASFCGIVTLNNVCKWLLSIYKFPILQSIGRNAMIIFIVHMMPIYLIVNVLENVCHISPISTTGVVCRVLGVFATIVVVCGYIEYKNKILFKTTKR